MPKRKRHASPASSLPSRKRCKLPVQDHTSRHLSGITHPVLAQVYHRITSLGDYLLEALPQASRVRRKRILDAAKESTELSNLLNRVAVGQIVDTPYQPKAARIKEELYHFTQNRRATQLPSAVGCQVSASEIVDFVIWSLFKSHKSSRNKPSHVLCHGLESSLTTHSRSHGEHGFYLPGILQRRPNANITFLKKPAWQDVLALAGGDGETVFCHLLMNCGLFSLTDLAANAYHQISGTPLHELSTTKPEKTQSCRTLRGPGSINIVRGRILYGRPSLTKEGKAQFGLQHTHALNRFSDLGSRKQDALVMRYIFPRQFQLHNVFTSQVDHRHTTQPSKDYTFREEECRGLSDEQLCKLPKRLRGRPLDLIRRLRKKHRRCALTQLLAHYCPVAINTTATNCLDSSLPATKIASQSVLRTQLLHHTSDVPGSDICDFDKDETSFHHFSIPHEKVAAFCSAALTRILPRDSFGVGESRLQNQCKIDRHIFRFVRARRFEAINLHELSQGIGVKSIAWLGSAVDSADQSLSLPEFTKRSELLSEFMYYVFDSLVIPLISSNFYVTESGVHRNRLFYFRHDVWLRLSAPSLASAKLGSLVPVRRPRLQDPHAEATSYSSVRLLPKEQGTRMITNLKRRNMKVINGKRYLGPSINSQLIPVFNIFNFEREGNTIAFNVDTFSLQDILPKLLRFQNGLKSKLDRPLYFVKVDIRSAFDSIPQKKLMELVNAIFKHEEYWNLKTAETRLASRCSSASEVQSTTRFMTYAQPKLEESGAQHSIVQPRVRKAVISNDVEFCRTISKKQAQDLLEQHVTSSTIRLGKQYYRKSVGIPQGSVLSSLLCTFFYNDFERAKLRFLDPKRSLLLRIIDDFLLITRSKSQAARFINAMKEGDESYGIVIHPEKSLVNFDMVVEGIQVPKVADQGAFPFCGLRIDMRTLEVAKDRVRKDNKISNSLTVDTHGNVGHTMFRRVAASLRIQLQTVLLDHKLNNRALICRTLSECFQETGMKLHQYLANLPPRKQPGQHFLKCLIEQLIALARQTVMKRQETSDMTLSHQQMSCLASVSFLRVFEKRQARYAQLLHWLRELKGCTSHTMNFAGTRSEDLVAAAWTSVQHYEY